MPNPKSASERVMLLLPRPLAEFVDHLASQLSTPGIVVNRQVAIRHTLSKLMKETTPPAVPPLKNRVKSKASR